VFARDRIISVLWCCGPLSTAVKPNAAVLRAIGELVLPATPTHAASESHDRLSFYLARNAWEFVRTVSPLDMAVECHPIATHHYFRISVSIVESSWNVMAPGDAWGGGGGKGNWRMEWVAITLHTTSEHGVSSITTADGHTSAASSRLNWHHRRFKWTRPFRRRTKSGLCACAITFQKQCTLKATMVVFSNEVCSTFTAMSSRTLLSPHTACHYTGHRNIFTIPDLNTQQWRERVVCHNKWK
jgi:hypothetical protein